MKRSLAATAIMGAMALAGCGDRQPADGTAAGDAMTAGSAAVPTADNAVGAAVPTPAVAGGSALPAAEGAPAFAVIYPGGTLDGPATVARNPDGPGGIISFTTDASPAEVIAFYRLRAEAAGLKSINTMNRGASMGYGAGGADGRGRNLSVVATSVEGQPTSVQLSWIAGR
jgi:hypothetical protein